MDLDKLNIQGMLDKFKQTKSGFDQTFRNIFTSEDDSAVSEDDVREADKAADTPENTDEEIGISETEIIPDAHEEKPQDNPIAPAAACYNDELSEKLGAAMAQIDSLNEALKLIKEDIESSMEECVRSRRVSENVNGKLNSVSDKISELSNSLAGISKLKDSIFDLKNSQMNTKNSIGALQSGFFKLKKKMTTGITIISILTTIIAILEILNLLS